MSRGNKARQSAQRKMRKLESLSRKLYSAKSANLTADERFDISMAMAQLRLDLGSRTIDQMHSAAGSEEEV